MKDWLIVQRISQEIAVLELENRESLELPLAVLPEGTKENDVLYLDSGRLYIDTEETERRQGCNVALFRSLFNTKEEKEE